jgi:hypothetical protein
MSFYTAKEAAAISNSRTDINLEVNRIEEAVMTAAGAGSREATIGPGSSPPVVSGFTNSSTHYEAYSDPLNYQTDAHKIARAQMNEVIGYFQRLNYTVRRAQHQSTDTFNWIVKW